MPPPTRTSPPDPVADRSLTRCHTHPGRATGERVSGDDDSETIRFHQKDPGADDKDVRVWTITDHGDGTFLAAPAAAF